MIQDVEVAGELFTRTISDLTAEQLRGPSLLPGWSRAHVIAHVALNAEGFVAVANTPEGLWPALMYPGGTTERDRDIATLAHSSTSQLLDRFREANACFIETWDPPCPLRDCATAEGHPTFSSSSVLQRRLRELQVHLIDLDVGDVGIDVWMPAFVEADLGLQWPTVAHRTSQPVVVDDEFGVRWETGPSTSRGPTPVVTRRQLLAWVLDRGTIEGMPRLEPWTNRSKWEWLSPGS